MPSVLIIGFEPHAVPGVDAEALDAVFGEELARFAEHSIDAATALIAPHDSAESIEAELVAALAERDWDVVLIGAGIRKPEPALPLFELVVNLAHRHAPGAALAFNSGIDDTFEAGRRRLASAPS
jgi:hypothetical protein